MPITLPPAPGGVGRKASPTLALSGRLERIGLADVLQILAAGRHSGTLTVERENPPARGEIELIDGRVVRATTSGTPQRLGMHLLRRGSLDADILADALARQSSAAAWKPIGTVLVEMGAIQPGDLGEALVEQMGECAAAMLRWDQGVFRFRVREAPQPSASEATTVGVALDPQEILLEAARRVDESTRRSG